MSFEAISDITQAEADAKAMVSAAETKARQMIVNAEAEGKAAIDAARAKADSELLELRKQADEKAKVNAQELSDDLENKKAALRAKAETRMEKAANLVVERIVNS